MLKRIVIGILSVVLAATLLCGCSFFSHDTERDMQQVVATVDAYTISVPIVGEEEPYKHTTQKVDIYKADLVEYVNNNYSSLIQSYPTAQSMYNYAIRMLANVEIVSNEVDALIAAGEIKWGVKQENEVRRRLYNVIDSTLVNIMNEILAERDEQPIITSGDSDPSSSTTYPVKPAESDDEEEEETDYEEPEWFPDVSRYPGVGVTKSDETKSLEREAVRRFLSLIYSRLEDDFRVTKEERAKLDADKARIQKIIDEQGIEEVYPMLWDTYYLYYLSGKSLTRSQKISELQDYLTKKSKVNDAEVMEEYNSMLNEQMELFDSDESSYRSAMQGSSTVLYHPAYTNIFYVKHILLPFSDEQKNALTEYKDGHTADEVASFRDLLVDGIVAYPHVDGEDDTSRPMTVDEVIAAIRSVMLPLEANVTDADRAFDDLVYLYNTDPGAFGNTKGYAVIDADSGNSWVTEFTDAARYMRANMKVGQVYYKPIVTDYGVHIMYLASVAEPGIVNINAYTTPGKHETYFEVIKAPLDNTRANAAYNSWEASVLTYNFNSHVHLYEKRYSDLWDEKKNK